jgi:hypothetical protein
MRSSSGFLSLPLPLRPVRAANAFFAALLEPPAPPPPPPPPPLLLVLAALRLYVDEDEVVDEVGADCAVVVSKDAFNAKRRLTWEERTGQRERTSSNAKTHSKLKNVLLCLNRHCIAIAPLRHCQMTMNDNANANAIPYPYSVQLSLSFLSSLSTLLNNVSFCARR